jgi:5-methylcytosine-specific restriction endonuclease McrA
MTDRRSPEALAWRKMYNTRTWKALRQAQLAHKPTCHMCLEIGRVTAGRVVDHVRPHKGDPALFFDALNLQTLCVVHHNSSKQREEKSERKTTAIGLDGWPLSRERGDQ